ncbi:MAG TPA: endonuclease Q family protein [Patescibacteria group bacterium]|nr:endonuclease Q family protein [Patescibacteria group bacterium]
MHYVADLHLHSKYSRAVSPQMTLPVMAQYALQKGLDILTASDFTHPLWFKEISEQVEEAGEGVYKIKNQISNIKNTNQNLKVEKEILFLLSTEISSIYKQGDKLRRIHNLIFVPSLETADKIRQELIKRGCNLNADGRPIVGLTSKALLELILSIDDRSFLIPCHIWTPHFGIYGSASGFDSLEEAFGDLAPQIYGIETGLSSDPDMNWQTKELMDRSILSFSDAHSPAKMGREATVFDLESPTYENIRQAIMRKGAQKNKIAYTVEFYPEEGKYHFSGHRNCKVVYTADDVKEKGTVCPVCRRKLTEGVFMRVEQLSDSTLYGRAVSKHNEQGLKWYTDKMHLQPPYVKLVPLLEIVAESLHSTVASQKSQTLFAKLCEELGSELEVLLRSPFEHIEAVGGKRVADGVRKVREGTIAINPGYDGEFGKVAIWSEEEEKALKEDNPQLGLGI